MKYNPCGLAVVLVLLLSAIPKAKPMLPRWFWVFFIVIICLIILDANVRAQDIQYCISMDKGNKVVMQCQNGTVTVVDNINDKVVVCSAGHNDTPRCQTLPLKADK